MWKSSFSFLYFKFLFTLWSYFWYNSSDNLYDLLIYKNHQITTPLSVNTVLYWEWIIIIDTLHKSHKAPVPFPTMHHFVIEMCTCVHISITKMVHYGIFVNVWCIVGFVRWFSFRGPVYKWQHVTHLIINYLIYDMLIATALSPQSLGVDVRLKYAVWCWNQNSPREIGQYHYLWCSGSLQRKCICGYDIEYAR